MPTHISKYIKCDLLTKTHNYSDNESLVYRTASVKRCLLSSNKRSILKHKTSYFLMSTMTLAV